MISLAAFNAAETPGFRIVRTGGQGVPGVVPLRDGALVSAGSSDYRMRDDGSFDPTFDASVIRTAACTFERLPTGRLREEREALRVKALAGLGRNDEARLAAKRFRERFPQSVLSNRIEETIRPDG